MVRCAAEFLLSTLFCFAPSAKINHNNGETFRVDVAFFTAFGILNSEFEQFIMICSDISCAYENTCTYILNRNIYMELLSLWFVCTKRVYCPVKRLGYSWAWHIGDVSEWWLLFVGPRAPRQLISLYAYWLKHVRGNECHLRTIKVMTTHIGELRGATGPYQWWKSRTQSREWTSPLTIGIVWSNSWWIIVHETFL